MAMVISNNAVKLDRKRVVRKWFTIVGCFLMTLPVGLPWYWGNMSTYVLSYIARRGKSIEGLHTPWVISFYFLFNAVGLFVAGSMSRYIGKRLVLLCGIVLFVGGLFLTYFSVQGSVSSVTVTLGFMSGVGGGVINGMALQYAIAWPGKDIGFVTSLVQSGFNAGPVFINPFVTMYANPDNKFPDVDDGPSKLFSEENILDNVPLLFVHFGLLCFGLEMVGFVFVRDVPVPTPEEEALLTLESSNTDTEEVQIMRMRIGGSSDSNEWEDKKPIEIVKTKSFYSLWICLMLFDNAMLVLANYYKEYGALLINDDHFLTFLGTVLTISTIVSFPAWGLITDRFGVKPALVSMYGVSSILCILMYFSPRLGKGFYMFNIAALGSCLPPIYSVLLIATCKLFGRTHYSSNAGVVASFTLLVNFILPLIFKKILYLGWFYIFCYAGCISAIGMAVIILILPQV